MQLDTCCTSECQNSHGLPMVMRRAFDLSEEMGFENNKCISAWKETPLVTSIMRMKSIQDVTIHFALHGTNFLLVPIRKAPLTSVEFHPLIQEDLDLLDITCSYIQPLLSFRVPLLHR